MGYRGRQASRSLRYGALMMVATECAQGNTGTEAKAGASVSTTWLVCCASVV